MNPLPIAVVLAMLSPVAVAGVAQEPGGAAAKQPQQPADATGWVEGFGHAVSYRAALAEALEDAVGKAKGIDVARTAALRSRMAVVTNHSKDLEEGWFDGEAQGEQEWVQQQIAGFVESYEITKKGKVDGGQWEVSVRAKIATRDARAGQFVIDLTDDDLRAWQLERFEEGGAAAPFDRAKGNYEGPSIRDNLRATGVVHVVAKAGGVDSGAGVAPAERDKRGQRLVASHRVVVTWQPMQLQSIVEKVNAARPLPGPRPQFLTAASVQAKVSVVDLVRDVEVLARPLTISLQLPPAAPVERLDAFVVQLADQAKAAVAETVYFALVPPVVLRKWAGDGGEWLVDVAMSRRVASGYDTFVVGNQGSLASPDWRPLGRAVLRGGNDGSCTFGLVDVADAGRVEVGVTEVRPIHSEPVKK